MQVLLNCFCLVLFFGTYYITGNIFYATAVAVVGGISQAIINWCQHKKLEGMQMVNLLMITIFGGATLIFHESHWIKWKSTALYWTFAVILLVGLIVHKNFLKQLLEKEITLPDRIWRYLAYAWAGFFVLQGSVNLWVAWCFNEKQWVTFKMLGSSGLYVLFILIQGIYLYPYLPKELVNKIKNRSIK